LARNGGRTRKTFNHYQFMKRSPSFLFLVSLFFVLSLQVQAVSVTVTDCTAGGLSTAITNQGYTLSQVTQLTITGTINALDFTSMNNTNMANLSTLDISSVSIVKVSGLTGANANTIPPYALQNCVSLTSVSLPTNLKAFGSSSFAGCSSLSSVTIPSGVTTIGIGSFSDCTALTSINIPVSVTVVNDQAFLRNSSLTTVTFTSGSGSSLSIGSGAFQECTSLQKVTLTSRTTAIADNAFSLCTSLACIDAVTLDAPIDLSSSSDVFYEVPTSCIVYTKAGTKSTYEAADQWGDLVIIDYHIWSGTGQWTSNTSYWSRGTVPEDNAIIYVQDGTLTTNASENVYGLFVEPSGHLTLSSDDILSVTTEGFTIQSDATGTGTFVDKNTSGGVTVSGGDATIQQYLTTGRNWYVSSPTASAALSGLSARATTDEIYIYDETTDAFTKTTATTLTPLTGYVAVANSTGNAVFTGGNINTGVLSATLTRTASNTDHAGFNLVGNPYPSYLDWDQVYTQSTYLDPTMWYRTKTSSGSAYVFETYNALSEVGTANFCSCTDAATSYIPPMQAFWVYVTEGNTQGTFTVNNTMRSHEAGTGSLLRSASTNKLLRLQVSNGTNSDQAIILFNTEASDDQDLFDSPKKSNQSASIPEIFTLVNNKQTVINGMGDLSDSKQMILGFKSSEANDQYAITASEISGFDEETKIILKDNLLSKEIVLSDTVSYNFTASSINSTDLTRFTIAFYPSGSMSNNETTLNSVNVISSDHKIIVNVTDNLGLNQVTVYNTIGQIVYSKEAKGLETFCSPELANGAYLVNVNASGLKKNFKIIVNQ
jgi:hypothetical protein